MGTLVATGKPWQQLQSVARTEFGRGPTCDYALLPLISLIKGRRLRRILSLAIRESVGEGAGIEDLWKELLLHRHQLLEAGGGGVAPRRPGARCSPAPRSRAPCRRW
jgi:hypothetical protein